MNQDIIDTISNNFNIPTLIKLDNNKKIIKERIDYIIEIENDTINIYDFNNNCNLTKINQKNTNIGYHIILKPEYIFTDFMEHIKQQKDGNLILLKPEYIKGKNIGYDFDGVLHTYMAPGQSLWHTHHPKELYNVPNEHFFHTMLCKLKYEMDNGSNIYIITARNSGTMCNFVNQYLNYFFDSSKIKILCINGQNKSFIIQQNNIHIFHDDYIGNINKIKSNPSNLEMLYHINPYFNEYYNLTNFKGKTVNFIGNNQENLCQIYDFNKKDTNKLNIMSYNISWESMVGQTKFNNKCTPNNNPCITAVSNIIKNKNYDIIALQEASKYYEIFNIVGNHVNFNTYKIVLHHMLNYIGETISGKKDVYNYNIIYAHGTNTHPTIFNNINYNLIISRSGKAPAVEEMVTAVKTDLFDINNIIVSMSGNGRPFHIIDATYKQNNKRLILINVHFSHQGYTNDIRVLNDVYVDAVNNNIFNKINDDDIILLAGDLNTNHSACEIQNKPIKIFGKIISDNNCFNTYKGANQHYDHIISNKTLNNYNIVNLNNIPKLIHFNSQDLNPSDHIPVEAELII
jgi:hypothetical protein